MRLRCFKNSMELADGRLLEMVQVYKYYPPSHNYPEDWDGDEPVFRIANESVDREEVLTVLSVEELEEFVDNAKEDFDWSPPGPDEFHDLS